MQIRKRKNNGDQRSLNKVTRNILGKNSVFFKKNLFFFTLLDFIVYLSCEKQKFVKYYIFFVFTIFIIKIKHLIKMVHSLYSHISFGFYPSSFDGYDYFVPFFESGGTDRSIKKVEH